MGDVLRFPGGGPSNSRPPAKSGGAGFDTVRLFTRDLTDAEVTRSRFDAQQAARGEFRRTAGGVTVGVWPDGRGYVEGRVAAILATDARPDDHRLASADELDEACAFAGNWLRTYRRHEWAVARADLASEAVFDNGEDGRRFLTALAELDVPWLKTGTEGGKRSGLETVYWRTAVGRSVVMRAYDKAKETGEGVPGTRVRVERQTRVRKSRQQTVAEFTGAGLRERFVGRELAWLIEQGPRTMTFGDVSDHIDEIRYRVDQGLIAGRVGERMIGYLVLRGKGLPGRTWERREAELRRHVGAVSFGAEPRELPIVPQLVALADAFAA